jgi:hypothetical protein
VGGGTGKGLLEDVKIRNKFKRIPMIFNLVTIDIN